MRNFDQPYVSIIIPAYNCEDTISETLDSILMQSYQNFEIVIINDGSTDHTVQIIMDYKKKHSNIFVIQSKNMGPGYARNLGIEKSSGDYLYFVDSDDKIHRNTLERYIKLINENQSDLVVSSYKMNVVANNETVSSRNVSWPKTFLSSQKDFLSELYFLMDQQLMYVIWNKFYKASIIKDNKIKFPPYKSCEDRLFNLQYFHHVNRCQITDEIMYEYSFEGNKSLTNKYLPNKFETFEEFYVELVNLTANNIDGSSALFLKEPCHV